MICRSTSANSKAAEAFEIQRMQRQLINTLAGLRVDCLQGRGVKVLEINLYDLAIELLKAREGEVSLA